MKERKKEGERERERDECKESLTKLGESESKQNFDNELKAEESDFAKKGIAKKGFNCEKLVQSVLISVCFQYLLKKRC